MARIEIKVVLDDETEIAVAQTVKSERRDGEAAIPSIGSALLGSAVPSVIRALGLRTQQDEAELMEQVAARASEMVQQVREAEEAEAAGAEQDAQVEEALDKHLAEEAAPEPQEPAEEDAPAPEPEPKGKPEIKIEIGPEAPSGPTPAQVEERAKAALAHVRKRDRR